MIDTTQQRHKSAPVPTPLNPTRDAPTPPRLSLAASKFYGPTRTTLSKLVAPWMKLYIESLAFEFHPREQPYLWSVGGDVTRCQTSSQWTQTVKAAFKKYSPNKTPCPPKLLRSSFITYLRGSDAAPEVLKSAATQMKVRSTVPAPP